MFLLDSILHNPSYVTLIQNTSFQLYHYHYIILQHNSQYIKSDFTYQPIAVSEIDFDLVKMLYI